MHLHAHSYYSFLSATLSVDRLVEHAVRAGARYLALTDTNNVTGATEFYTKCREAGIRPLIGAELRAGREAAVLLARSNEGYRRLCEAVSKVAERHPPARVSMDDSPRGGERETPADSVPDDESMPLSEIIAECQMRDVTVLAADVRLLEELRARAGNFGLYVELSGANEGRWPELLRTADRLRLPAVATNPVRFGDPLGRRLHTVLRAISANATLGTIGVSELAHESQYFCGEAEFAARFAELPEALRARDRIAETCEVEFDFTSSKFTAFDDRGHPEKFAFLRGLAEAGFTERYASPTRAHHERLEKELRLISELGFTDYFLVAWDVVQYAMRRNFPYVGRGSGANSMVAYCLRITNVDPIELDLFFERFLNPERRSPPDFDIDFSWRNRDEVIAWLLEKYDPQRTAMIGTISTFNPRGALRDTGKALGFSEAEIRQCVALLPGFGSMRDLQDPDSPFRRHAGILLESEYGKRWLELAVKILSFPNHYGIHSGGVILAPDELTRYTATQTAPKGIRITQQEMFSMEYWRLEKIDILSTTGLGTFEDTMKAVKERTGAFPPVLDYRNACSDEKTKSLVRSGRTVGCFYIESPAMIQLLRKLRTDSFEMLTAASSIIRPGVAQSGMMQEFIDRYHDPSRIKPPHPAMAELLKSTFGVMVYQEDVIKVAHFVGKLSLGDADLLRRAMSGKMRSREAMQRLRERFFRGCRSQGIDDSATAEIWRQMESFAGYSFCKAHSASYAVLSFQEAWLKAHHPALFLCAVLNNQGGYYRPEGYIQEARRLGIRIILPDVNRSGELHSCPDDSSIQLGFLHVKDLTAKGVASLIAERENAGPYASTEDFLLRSGLTRDDAGILIRCGACDSFGEERSSMMAKARLLLKSKGAALNAELPLPPADFSKELSHLPAYSAAEVAQVELETFSYTVSSHVLNSFAEKLAGAVKADELARHVGRRVEVGGWMIAAKPARTRKGERMMFMNLDDGVGSVDVVVFPACYRRSAHFIRTAGPYRVRGRVAEEYGVLTVSAETIELLSSGP